MIRDFWTLLLEMISQDFAIKKVRINMCQILDIYGVVAAWNLEKKLRSIENKWNKIISNWNIITSSNILILSNASVRISSPSMI